MPEEYKNVVNVSVRQAKEVCPTLHSIDDDIILLHNFAEVPLPVGGCRMQSLFLVLCTRGHATYTVDTREQRMQANDIIVLSEGQLITDYELSDDCDGVGVMMSYDFFHDAISGVHEMSRLFLFAKTSPVFHLSDSQRDVLLEYSQQMVRKITDTEHHFRKQLLGSIIRSIIYEVSNIIYQSQQTDTTRKTRAETIFTKFIRLVEQNFRSERRVSWYAQQLCITPKYLSETVKAVSKRRPNDWIDNYVTMEIRVMLRNSTMSIKEIAQELNFANQSFLGKYFKEHVGMSPKEYRKK